MLNEKEKQLIRDVFEIDPDNISTDELRKLKTRAKQKWHPDKFSHLKNKKIVDIAHQYYTQIDDLIEILNKEFHEKNNPYRSSSYRSEDDEKLYKTCTHCGTKNRVSKGSNLLSAKCGRCKKPLTEKGTNCSGKEEPEQRQEKGDFKKGKVPPTNFISADRFAQKKNYQIENVIEAIRVGDIKGTFRDGDWFVEVNNRGEFVKEEEKKSGTGCFKIGFLSVSVVIAFFILLILIF